MYIYRSHSFENIKENIERTEVYNTLEEAVLNCQEDFKKDMEFLKNYKKHWKLEKGNVPIPDFQNFFKNRDELLNGKEYVFRDGELEALYNILYIPNSKSEAA